MASGGISALTGALAYSELGNINARSGGEYHFYLRFIIPLLVLLQDGFFHHWFCSTHSRSCNSRWCLFCCCLNLNLTFLTFGLDKIIALSVIFS